MIIFTNKLVISWML